MARGSSNSDLRKSRGLPEGYEFKQSLSSGTGTPLVLIEQVGVDRSDRRNNPVTNLARKVLDKGFGYNAVGETALAGGSNPKKNPKAGNYLPDEVLGNFGGFKDGNIYRDIETSHPALYKQLGKGLTETIIKDMTEEARREARLMAGYQATKGKTEGEIYVASPKYKIPAASAVDRADGVKKRYAGGEVVFSQKIRWRLAKGSDRRDENPKIEFFQGWVSEPSGRKERWSDSVPNPFSSKESQRNTVVETRRGR